MSTGSETAVIRPARSRPATASQALRSHTLLVLLMLTAVFGYADLQLVALLASNIKTAFRLSDTVVGGLQGIAVNLSTALALIPVGLLVDKSNRVRLLLLTVAMWSLFTLLTGVSGALWQLFICRVGVGVAEAAVYPAAYSLIADLYSPRRRALAVSVFFFGTLAGASAATTLSGVLIRFMDAVATAHGAGFWGLPAWRLTFFAEAAPGFLLVVALMLAREPSRRDHEVVAGHPVAETFLKFFFRERSLLVRLVLATVALQAGLTSIGFWIPTVFTRLFGFSAGQAGEWLGVMFGLGSLSGTAIGTALLVLLRRRNEALAPLTVLRIGAGLAALAVLALPFAPTALGLAATITVFFAATYVGAVVSPTVLMAVAPSELRGRLISLQVFLIMFSAALTPPLIGALSDHVFGGARGLLEALSVVAIACDVLAPLMLVKVRRPFERLQRSFQPIAEA